MQPIALFPLTLALSLRERESVPQVWVISLDSGRFPALSRHSLSPRERVGVRGKAASDGIVTY